MIKLYNDNNINKLKELPDNSIDSVVTDPPYGIKFMSKKWDYQIPSVETWQEVFRVLKPGGHILVACGTRTQHRMACNIEDAGFEIRDLIAWVYGSGFPKSLNIGKAIDKILGNKRIEYNVNIAYPDSDVWGVPNKNKGSNSTIWQKDGKELGKGGTIVRTKGNSKYEGWGTALKPAMELWTLARKPLDEKTIAKNVLKWGTGGINIDECRIEGDWMDERDAIKPKTINDKFPHPNHKNVEIKSHSKGRFPANFIHDGSDEVVSGFPESKSNGGGKFKSSIFCGGRFYKNGGLGDNGSNSRFFYCAKSSKSERNLGCEELTKKNGGSNAKGYTKDVARGLDRNKPVANHHPTVKPIKLMRYLCRLITPKDGTILDLFMGSGTTGIAAYLEGFNFIGIELNEEYFEIAKARINYHRKQEVIL